MSLLEMPMDEQIELNIESKRLSKKVAIYEMEAKERKKNMPAKMKKQIKERVAALQAQFKTKE